MLDEIKKTTKNKRKMIANEEQFEKLCKEYGFSKAIDRGIILMEMTFLYDFYPNNDGFILEMAKLIDFLRSVIGSEIKLEGIVKSPRNGEVKGRAKKCSIKNRFLISALEEYLNTLLEKNKNVFQYFLKFKDKQHLKRTVKLFHGNEVTEEDDYLTEPYTEEELNQILDHEKEANEENNRYNENGQIGMILKEMYEELKLSKVFGIGANTQRKEYCFLYDYLVLAGKAQRLEKGFTGDLGKEKADWVKNKMASYETQYKK